MQVKVSTTLNCPIGQAWELVQRSDTLVYVSRPLAVILPEGKPFPETWRDKGVYYCKSYLFGFIPVGKRKIFLEKVDSVAKEIQSRESDPLIKKWDHLISIQTQDSNHCIYSDQIEIKAGVLTFVVWLWANWFYRHRPSRWRRLVGHAK